MAEKTRDIVRVVAGQEIWVNGVRLHNIAHWDLEQQFIGECDVTTFGDSRKTYVAGLGEPIIHAKLELVDCIVEYQPRREPVKQIVATMPVPAEMLESQSLLDGIMRDISIGYARKIDAEVFTSTAPGPELDPWLPDTVWDEASDENDLPFPSLEDSSTFPNLDR